MIGKILGNRYEVIEQIGGGGMALVYKAKCRLLDRFVAIKVLRDEFTEDEDFIRKFRRESQAAASLSHPNILNIYDVGSEEDDDKKIHYIVMEYIKGKTLKEVIKEKGKLSTNDTLNYSLQIAEALQHAHRNHIVHRDIKPHNIMITEDLRVKVTDFGIARAVTSSTVTTTSNVLGSVHYFSPEQARGGYTDEKSDIYSLGIVMYEMTTGKVPYEGDSPISVALKHVQDEIVPPREVESTIPLNLEAIILRCVQKRQSDRYNNITDLITELKKVRMAGNNTIANDEDIESATRLIPIVNTENEKDIEKVGKQKKTKKTNVKKDKKSDGNGVVFLGIIAAFLLVTSLFFGYVKLRDFLASDEIVVPGLIGMQEADAEKAIKDLGLQFNVVDRIKSSEFEAGEVISQNVEEGSKVKGGYPIGVTISEGEDLVVVPLVVNRTLSEAEAIIIDSGLRVGTVDPGFSNTVPVGIIISQSPEAVNEVAPGTRINLIISEGPEVRNVIMPKVVGTTINQARNTIVGLDLAVGEITYQPSSDVAADIVIWQSYEQGTELETQTSVDLYVSSGPDTTPPVEEPGEPDPGQNNGVGSITLTLTPFQDRDETEIKINRRQDGFSEVVYNRRHQASEVVVLTFEGNIGAQFEILFDGIYQGTRSIEE